MGQMMVKEVKLVYVGRARAVKKIDSPGEAYNFFGNDLIYETREVFLVAHLDNKNNVLGWTTCAIGTISECLVHPREVFAEAVARKAASVMLIHNHPSGELEPSKEDRATAKRLIEAGKLMGIPVLDFLIFAVHGHYSFFENHREIWGQSGEVLDYDQIMKASDNG